MRKAIAFVAAVTAPLASTSCSAKSLSATLSPSDLRTSGQVRKLNDSIARVLKACGDVSLRFVPGTYTGVSFTIDDRGRSAGCAPSVSFDRASTREGRVIFDGRQQPKFIDIVTDRAAFPGTIRHLEVRNYKNGIVVTRTHARKGERVTWARTAARSPGNGRGLLISNVVFMDVGDWSRGRRSKETGWGAIIFNFAHRNRIVGNRFEGLGNAVDSPLMHAIYLVGSDSNEIRSNEFGAMDGAAIKLRDSADGNSITGNVFRYDRAPLLQLWFCNADVRGQGKCDARECPSTATIFEHNRIIISPKDRSRRGAGLLPITNPFVSYETMQDVKVAERYYLGKGRPKACNSAPQRLLRAGAGNLVVQRAH